MKCLAIDKRLIDFIFRIVAVSNQGVIDLGEALPPWQRGLRLADPDGHRLIVLE